MAFRSGDFQLCQFWKISWSYFVQCFCLNCSANLNRCRWWQKDNLWFLVSDAKALLTSDSVRVLIWRHLCLIILVLNRLFSTRTLKHLEWAQGRSKLCNHILVCPSYSPHRNTSGLPEFTKELLVTAFSPTCCIIRKLRFFYKHLLLDTTKDQNNIAWN